MKKKLGWGFAALLLLLACIKGISVLCGTWEQPPLPVLQTDPQGTETTASGPTWSSQETESTKWTGPGHGTGDTQAPDSNSETDTTIGITVPYDPDISQTEPAENPYTDHKNPDQPHGTHPAETEQTEPAWTEDASDETVPTVKEPVQTERPDPTEETPAPTEEEPAETEPVQPPVTQAPPEMIDTALLEAHARSYARETYGYGGDTSLGFDNSGYFPGVTVYIPTMADGYAAAEEAVDYQYQSDMNMGYPVVTIINGVECRAKLNVYFEPQDAPNMFIVWCFYG